MITVFTPTYNRAYILPVLYSSLIQQAYKDFEWLIVDDGSTDNTEEIVKKMIGEKLIDIQYLKKENGGKHTAHNLGVGHARGDLFFICDSDDYLNFDALEYVNEQYKNIINDEKIVGFIGYRGSEDGYFLRNKRFEDGIVITSLYDLFFNTGLFDTVQIYKTDILKEYLFPEYENERFFPENYCWGSMDLDGYKVKVLRKILEIAEYREDGLTADKSGSCSVNKNRNSYRDYSYVMYRLESRRPLKRWRWGG